MINKIFKFFLSCLLFIFIIILINNIFKEGQKKELITKIKEIKNMEKYYKLCSNGILLNKEGFKTIKEPKISIISPIYNKEKYILRFLRSIQNQFFDEIEIILIDDCSKDNSIKKIQKFQKEDKRIKLIKHNETKGTLICRNEGSIISKGKYLIFGDPDDLFSSNIFDYSYKKAEQNSYDIIRYNIYNGENRINLDYIINKLKSKPIYQPELSSYIFYGYGKLLQIDFFIWNKLIKKETFIKTLKKIDSYYLNQYMIDCEDGLINYMLHKTAKSFYFSKNIGYYYILNNESITLNSKNNFKKRLKSNFLYFKFIYHYTENNEKEKKIAEYIFFSIYDNNKSYIDELLKEIKDDLEFYKEIINLYLSCKFISNKTKTILKKIKFYL